MSVIKIIEIMSSSNKSWEDASALGIAKASKTIKNLKSAWVKDQSVLIKDDKIIEFRVTLKLSLEVI